MRSRRGAAWTCRFANASVIAPVVAGLFFPQCRELGLEVDYDCSPSVCRKIVRAGTKQASFEAASEDLLETGEIRISAERVRRLTERVGAERVAERASQAAAFAALPLPERGKALLGQTIPDVACVQMDGGRLQIRDRQQPQRNDKHTFWREFKAGCLWSMRSEPGTSDPCPQLPSHFVNAQRMQRLVREIKGFSGPEVRKPADEELDEPPIDERPKRPEPVARSVVATCSAADNFGPLLAAEAHARNFFAAPRKAYVADGSETNWSIWRQWFADFVPILDFIHAVTYVYAAAMAGASAEQGWRAYAEWAHWLWSGDVDRVIAALELRLAELGGAAEGIPETSPAAIVAKSRTYFRNQRTRMNYPAYRQQGLPITSSYVESTVKQLNRRIKGTEKFWSLGAEALTTLTGDHLSDTPTLARFWRNRPLRLTGTRRPNPPAEVAA